MQIFTDFYVFFGKKFAGIKNCRTFAVAIKQQEKSCKNIAATKKPV